jgi:hypothetical protein
MSKDQKPVLNEKEKKKVLDTIKLIYDVFKEISIKSKKSKWEILKHPLIILCVGSLISGFLIYKYQQYNERAAERLKAKYDLSREVIGDIFSDTGDILSKAKIIIQLHSEAISDNNQIMKANEAYNAAYDNFFSNFQRICKNLRIAFKKDTINDWWDNILNRIEELDELLNLLLEFQTTKISEVHSERIIKSEEKIKKIKSELSLLYDYTSEIYK